MNARRIDELDEMARNFATGEMERREVWSLNFLESWFVTYLGALYCYTRIGLMSREQCAEFKFKLAGIYRSLALSIAQADAQQKRWCSVNMEASLKLSEAMRELQKDDADAERFIGLVMDAVDIFCLTDVHFKLTAAKLRDPDFKKKCQDAVRKHADEWQERIDNQIRWEDYMTLLEEFYAEELESGVASVAASLDPEELRDFARRGIPVKTDYPRKIVEILKAAVE